MLGHLIGSAECLIRHHAPYTAVSARFAGRGWRCGDAFHRFERCELRHCRKEIGPRDDDATPMVRGSATCCCAEVASARTVEVRPPTGTTRARKCVPSIWLGGARAERSDRRCDRDTRRGHYGLPFRRDWPLNAKAWKCVPTRLARPRSRAWKWFRLQGSPRAGPARQSVEVRSVDRLGPSERGSAFRRGTRPRRARGSAFRRRLDRCPSGTARPSRHRGAGGSRRTCTSVRTLPSPENDGSGVRRSRVRPSCLPSTTARAASEHNGAGFHRSRRAEHHGGSRHGRARGRGSALDRHGWRRHRARPPEREPRRRIDRDTGAYAIRSGGAAPMRGRTSCVNAGAGPHGSDRGRWTRCGPSLPASGLLLLGVLL